MLQKTIGTVARIGLLLALTVYGDGNLTGSIFAQSEAKSTAVAEPTNTAAAEPTNTAAAEPTSTAVGEPTSTGVAEPRVLVVGEAGFVGQTLLQSKKVGTASGFDLLVVGDADLIAPETRTLVDQALASGKEVVLDGPSDGSSRIVHDQLLKEITGMTIGSAAVRIQKNMNGRGYSVTPIDHDTPTTPSEIDAAANNQNLHNNVSNIFGISGSGK